MLKRVYYYFTGVKPSEAPDMRNYAKNDFLTSLEKTVNDSMRIAPPTGFQSFVRSAFAFIYSAMSDIMGAIMNPKKMKKWMAASRQFDAYLEKSGVGGELHEAIMKPMVQGRLFFNMKILNDVQEKEVVSRFESAKIMERHEIQDELEKGKRIMRFATAAYGTEMIKSAIDKVAEAHELENTKKAIAFHTNVPEEDIELLCVNDGGDMHLLRHFVCVDRETKSVVLAIRGTLSLSGGLVDMQAMDCEFCTGRAHKGIAEMTDRLWAESGHVITNLLAREEFHDFNFVITGHSLGAGAACLLHIKCYVEQLLPYDRVTCFGFAPPPVFCLDRMENRDEETVSRIEQAVENCICYVNDNDCVPHLSVSSIRKLARELDIVDDRTEVMSFWRRFKIFWEYEGVPRNIEDALVTKSRERLEKVVGESNMVIPARVLVWMKKNFAGSVQGIGCCPKKMAGLGIFLCEDMVSDHLPEGYEDALDELVA